MRRHVPIALNVTFNLSHFQHKTTVTDPAIFRKLAAYWEGKFFEDMARLRVLEPDVVTRVTEYVPENVAFVEKIITNGYAYEADGSVYFNTPAFAQSENHDYAKLEPWSTGNRDLLEGGEGKCFRPMFADLSDIKIRFTFEPDWETIGR